LGKNEFQESCIILLRHEVHLNAVADGEVTLT